MYLYCPVFVADGNRTPLQGYSALHPRCAWVPGAASLLPFKHRQHIRLAVHVSCADLLRNEFAAFGPFP